MKRASNDFLMLMRLRVWLFNPKIIAKNRFRNEFLAKYALKVAKLWGEFVANTPDRMEKDGVLGILFKVLSKRQNEIVHRPGRRVDVIPPDRLQYLLPGNHFVLSLDEQL